MPSTPAIASPSPPLFSCTEIANRISAKRGKCNRSTVWRLIRRLKIQPSLVVGSFSFYTEADADLVAGAMRRPNAVVQGEA